MTARSVSRRVVIGVDGGGTKTDVVAVTTDGELLASSRAGTANWEGVGLETMASTLNAAVTEVLDASDRHPSEVVASAFCLAGVDWPSDEDRMKSHLDGLGLSGVWAVTNDSFAALRAGTPLPWGCVSVAGTGGVTAGRNRTGTVARTMGIGWGEGRGAWGLVESALHMIAAAEHGSIAATSLAPAFLERCDSPTVAHMFEEFSRQWTGPGTDHAPLVMDAAREGDAAAIRCCRDAGAQHGVDTTAVAEKLGMLDEPFDLVLAGGLHLNGAPAFSGAFAETVRAGAPLANLRLLTAPPAVGAALLALELIGITTQDLFDDLVAAAAERVPPELEGAA